MTSRVDAVVIGAGPNGLTAALALARAGRRVVVLERRDVAGGLAIGDEFHSGYRAAGLLTDTSGVRRSLLRPLGLDAHGLRFKEADETCYVAEPDGPGLLVGAELSSSSASDVGAWNDYHGFIDRIRRFTNRVLDQAPPDATGSGWSDMMTLAGHGVALRRLGRDDMMELLRVAPMCVADWLNERFESGLLKCALAWRGLDGAFMGPWSPGSAANLLRWEALRGPGVYGGGPALIGALEAAVRAAGVEVRTGADVECIRVDKGRTTGVTLAGGELIDAAMVAASCDPRQALIGLVERGALAPELERRLEHYRTEGTTAQVNLALSEPLRFAGAPDLEWTRACVGATFDEMERAFDAVKYERCSERPIVELLCPSAEDPTAAPEGHAVVSAIVRFAPYHLRGGWTGEQRTRLGDVVVETITRVAPSVTASIVAREVLTPVDIEQRFGVTHGHEYHGEHGLDQLLTRPTPETARYRTPINGLFLCGSGSHPGGGLTCAPGALGAAAILG